MSDGPNTFGFPAGYFVIRSVATDRLLDVAGDGVEDSSEILLWPEKENSLVEYLRDPHANNQVFFVDTSGALCSRSSGHAVDIEDDRLVLRHRRPISFPYPNHYSHPLPIFSFDGRRGEISVTFPIDPIYYTSSATASPRSPGRAPIRPISPRPQAAYKFLLASIPSRRRPSFAQNAGQFFQSNLVTPVSGVLHSASLAPSALLALPAIPGLSFGKAAPASLSPPPLSPTRPSGAIRPDEVFDGRIELGDEDTLEQDRGEEGEVDDSPDRARRVLVVKAREDKIPLEKANLRRKWEIVPLRKGKAFTGGI